MEAERFACYDFLKNILSGPCVTCSVIIQCAQVGLPARTWRTAGCRTSPPCPPPARGASGCPGCGEESSTELHRGHSLGERPYEDVAQPELTVEVAEADLVVLPAAHEVLVGLHVVPDLEDHPAAALGLQVAVDLGELGGGRPPSTGPGPGWVGG